MLREFGVHPKQAKLDIAVGIWLDNGNTADLSESIQADPYLIARTIPGYGFVMIDRMARRKGIKSNDARRGRAAVYQSLINAQRDGSCWLPYTEALGIIQQFLGYEWDRDTIASLMQDLITERLITIQAVAKLSIVALTTTWQRLIETQGFIERLAENKHPLYGEGEAREVVTAQTALTDGQRAAMTTALTNQACVITGGAGTGKTYTIGALTKFLRDQGHTVALAAPTGKAADRLNQTLDISADDEDADGDDSLDAKTMHRMLKCRGFIWEHGPYERLPAKFVIIDESSMVTLELAWRLLRSIRGDATVIFVGDPNQLPPVGAGYILRDLLESEQLPIVRLDQIVRQAGALRINSSRILKGEVAPTVESDEKGFTPWVVAEFDDLRTLVQDLIQRYRDEYFQSLGFNDPLNQVQILTPTHKTLTGDLYLNLRLQQFFQNTFHGLDLPDPPAPSTNPGNKSTATYYVHDRVIQGENNYTLNVMNGAVGVVTDVREAPGGRTQMMVEFDHGRIVSYGWQNIQQLSLAYALTVHKAQGSEFPCVVVLLHATQPQPLRYRNLFYTAVTRAQKTVLILGDSSIHETAKTLKEIPRRGLLTDVALTANAERGPQ